MSAFQQGKMVEAEALRWLTPFIQEHAEGGQWVLTEKGRLAPLLQEIVGDMLFRSKSDSRLYGVELKSERTFTGNLFLEIWSNRNLDDRDSHAQRGSNPGWLLKTSADLLFYYFIDEDRLYVIDIFKLKNWAFDHARVFSREFREVRQNKYKQMNDTWGRLVPTRLLRDELGAASIKLLHPRQMALWKEPLLGSGAVGDVA